MKPLATLVAPEYAPKKNDDLLGNKIKEVSQKIY